MLHLLCCIKCTLDPCHLDGIPIKRQKEKTHTLETVPLAHCSRAALGLWGRAMFVMTAYDALPLLAG